jgi:hypothetical protein
MRVFRVSAVGLLIASGLMVLAPAASGAVPGVSKTCKSLQSLDKQLTKVLDSSNAGKYNSGTVSDLSKSFKKGEKTAPKSLRSSMGTIATVAASAAAAGNPTAALAVIRNAGAKLTAAAVTWGTYLSKNCGVSSTAS